MERDSRKVLGGFTLALSCSSLHAWQVLVMGENKVGSDKELLSSLITGMIMTMKTRF